MGLEFLLLPQNILYSITLAICMGLFLIEVLSLVLGFGLDEIFDNIINIDTDLDADFDINSMSFSGILSWIGFGKVPFIIVLVLFLGSFGLSGIILQSIVYNILGLLLPKMILAPIAFITCLPITSIISRKLSKFIPDDESTSVNLEDLVGSKAIITLGKATLEMSAEAKVEDHYGKTHYIRVIPDVNQPTFIEGDTVILNKYENNRFKVSKTK